MIPRIHMDLFCWVPAMLYHLDLGKNPELDRLRIRLWRSILQESAMSDGMAPDKPDPFKTQERRVTDGNPMLATGGPVVHPKHYNTGKIEVIDAIEDWRLGFNPGNAVKYIARHEHKGTAIQDLEKAKWYIEREIARLKAK
jgi:hypothetical protein